MTRDKLREELLNLKPYPEDLKMRIEAEIAATRERPLKPWERWLMGACAIVLTVLLPYKLSLLFRNGLLDSVPAWCLSLFGGFILLGCGGLVYVARTVKRGTTRPRDGHLIIYAAAILFAGKILTEFILDGTVSGGGIIAGFVIVGALAYTRLEAVEHGLRERQLQTELALAELTEKVAARESDK